MINLYLLLNTSNLTRTYISLSALIKIYPSKTQSTVKKFCNSLKNYESLLTSDQVDSKTQTVMLTQPVTGPFLQLTYPTFDNKNKKRLSTWGPLYQYSKPKYRTMNLHNQTWIISIQMIVNSRNRIKRVYIFLILGLSKCSFTASLPAAT